VCKSHDKLHDGYYNGTSIRELHATDLGRGTGTDGFVHEDSSDVEDHAHTIR